MTLPIIIALVDDTNNISDGEMSKVAGALQEQIMADFRETWRSTPRASVVVTDTPGAAQWAVHIQNQLDDPGALGYHSNTDTNQPVAFVEYDRDWPVTVSHEVLEMIADPFGNRLHSARLPYGLESLYNEFGLPTDKHHVHYLLEVCDPCERTTYNVGGVDLSDFLTPNWYRTFAPANGAASSHAGGCVSEREVAEGGYVSFCSDNGCWFQTFNSQGKLEVRNLGKFNRSSWGSLREFTDAYARSHRSS
jgi:hypothetical protein